MPSTAVDHALATDPADDAPVTNREFVALVRARLDAAGHRDIPIERSWIDEDTPGYPFLLNVPIGAELVVPLKALEGFVRVSDPLVVARHADHYAKALVNLKRAERSLLKYARDVRREATKVIAGARADGFDLSLADVTFKPTYAYHLTGSAWKEAAYHVLAEVKVRHTSFYLRPEVSSVIVEDPGDVAKEFESIIGDERDRQARVAYLDGLGADLIIDAITLDLLRTHVVDVADVLRKAWKKQHVSIPVNVDGFDTELSLVTSDGSVQAGLILPEAFWNGELLWLLGDEVTNGLDLVGKTLADLVSHPALACRTVTRIDRVPEGMAGKDVFHLDTSGSSLFDADTGRIWPLPSTLAA